MHVRIRNRRESVGGKTCEQYGPQGFTKALGLTSALESRAVAIEAAGVDERLPALMATIKSARLIIEMSAQCSETARHLMPCATAALLHVQSEMLLVARKFGERAENPAGMSHLGASSNVAPKWST